MKWLVNQLLQRLSPVFARTRLNRLILANDQGFARSVREMRPVDASGNPLPWYTYPAIEYLSQFDWSGASVFEFGSGYSSRFWAARAARVDAVDNDPAWHAEIAAARVPRLTVHLRTTREAYLDCLAQLGARFDLIVIDGRWRRACGRVALGHLAEGGIIVLDNADWYPNTASDLRAAGFWQVDFSGFGPVNEFTWTTAVFLGRERRWQARLGAPAPVGGHRLKRDDDA